MNVPKNAPAKHCPTGVFFVDLIPVLTGGVKPFLL
jgi:hypothetical protein